MAESKVQLDVFEGPLDLLLYLVKKQEVDIYQVNLTQLATQFIEYLDLMRDLDLDVAGEFIVMAATLMQIKSRELLPVDQQSATEEEDEGLDPKWQLIRQLVEYKKFKDAAAKLQEQEWAQADVFPRVPSAPAEAPATPPPSQQVSVFVLINAVSAVLKRFNQREDSRDIVEDRWTVSEKIEYLAQFIQTQPRLKFSELFTHAISRSEVVVTFLALLELIRLRQLLVAQPKEFGEIEIVRAPTALPDPAKANLEP